MEMATYQTSSAPPPAVITEDVLAWIRELKGRPQRLVVCYLTEVLKAHSNGGHYNGNGRGSAAFRELRRILPDPESPERKEIDDELRNAFGLLWSPAHCRDLLESLHGLQRTFEAAHDPKFI
ncbi:MAG: hypothetical protein HYT22_03750 [Candidatus Niyogibacteria bacterium]|nr:hypothetical protein [Candidatus Niyogibacteria bacterium]